jgi:hypothetical protein
LRIKKFPSPIPSLDISYNSKVYIIHVRKFF